MPAGIARVVDRRVEQRREHREHRLRAHVDLRRERGHVHREPGPARVADEHDRHRRHRVHRLHPGDDALQRVDERQRRARHGLELRVDHGVPLRREMVDPVEVVQRRRLDPVVQPVQEDDDGARLLAAAAEHPDPVGALAVRALDHRVRLGPVVVAGLRAGGRRAASRGEGRAGERGEGGGRAAAAHGSSSPSSPSRSSRSVTIATPPSGVRGHSSFGRSQYSSIPLWSGSWR